MSSQSKSLLLPSLGSLVVVVACTNVTDARRRGSSSPVPSPIASIDDSAYAAAGQVQLPPIEPEEHPSLHNVFRLSEHIVSGSEPHGEKAFEILRAKGVKTILSVDGKAPDAALAAKYGMRYVHVPIQYKGISPDEMAKIAKTFREKPGPFFVHCFHGKHRGPAAAAVGRLVLDGVPRETALAEMRQWCGTSKSYEGLYRTIAQAPIPDAAATRALRWDFPSASPLHGVAGAMVGISRADDHVKACSKRHWQVDPAHPDLDPANEAATLSSLFGRASGMQETKAHPADFREWMLAAGEQSRKLQDAIVSLRGGKATAADADKAYKTLAGTCKACHRVYRN